jgi:hypothetical protein
LDDCCSDYNLEDDNYDDENYDDDNNFDDDCNYDDNNFDDDDNRNRLSETATIVKNKKSLTITKTWLLRRSKPNFSEGTKRAKFVMGGTVPPILNE